MNAEQILLRGLPLLSAVALAWAWRSPARLPQWVALGAGAAALVSRADAPQSGLLLAAVALGSALALLVGRSTDRAFIARALVPGAAAAVAAAIAPSALDLTVVGNAVVEPAVLLRGAVAAAAWATAVSLPRGPAVAWLAVGLLWLPWGLPGFGAPQLAAYAASPLEDGAALVRVGAHGLAGASDSPWQGWLALVAMAVVTAVLGAASAGWIRRPKLWLWALPLTAGVLLAGYSWMGAQADLQSWRPLGMGHAQALVEPWAWDLGPWALQLWRWVAVAALGPQAVSAVKAEHAALAPETTVLGALSAGAALALLGWWAVVAPDWLGPTWIEDPSLWATAAAIGASAAARAVSGGAGAGWLGPVAAVQWVVALAIAGGARSGGAVTGLLP